MLGCAGDWYRAAIYADGHQDELPEHDQCLPVTAHIAQNIISDNDIGVLVYFLPRVVVRNNVFLHNEHGLVLNHLNQHALVANNTFYDHPQEAVMAAAPLLHFHDNIVAGAGVGFAQENAQEGGAACNLFHEAPVGAGAVTLGVAGNVEADPLFDDPTAMCFDLQPGSPATDGGCFGPSVLDVDGSAADMGATAGLLGDW